MTGKDLIEKLTNLCCSGLDHEEDKKPTKISSNVSPSKKNQVAEEPKKEKPHFEGEQEPVQFSGKDTKYLDYKWDSLPNDAREAAVALGYDQDAWDNAGWPVTQDKWWSDLTEEETAGALAMGWDETSWDNKYEELKWADIPPKVKLAAETIGFDEHMWDHGHWPEAEHKSYDDLTKEEKRCVNVFGYNIHDWNK